MTQLFSAQPDLAISPAPSDTVQSMKFSPNSEFLACSAWDGTVSLWQVRSGVRIEANAQVREEVPVLSLAWNTSNTAISIGTASGSLKLWDLARGQTVEIGRHAQGIRSVLWTRETEYVITGSWDKSIRLWDLRSAVPALSIPNPGRIFGMACTEPILSAVESEHIFAVWDIRQLQRRVEPLIVADSSMKYQLRSVAVAESGRSIAVGTVDGRVAIKNLPNGTVLRVETDFAFKCHRDKAVHSVNCVGFHPVFDVLYTGGSDGQICSWDRIKRQKLSCLSEIGGPVTAFDLSSDGNLLAYASGYDWMYGIEQAGSVPVRIAVRDIRNDFRLGRV